MDWLDSRGRRARLASPLPQMFCLGTPRGQNMTKRPRMSNVPNRDAEHHAASTCPCCRGQRTPIFWSKAGMTSRLCEAHKQEARAYRRAYG